MSIATTSTVRAGERANRPGLDGIPEALIAMVHVLGRFKQQIAQATRGNPEWAYDAILFHVVSAGPIRSSVLADLVQADPSTVSRQVAALVRDGLLERVTDPEDRRAALLQVTDDGLARYRRHVEQRDKHYRAMLKGWSAADRRQFAALLRRFTADFESYRGMILADVTAAYQPSSTREAAS